MSFESLLIETVTITTPTSFGPTVDRYGNEQPTNTVTNNVPCRIEAAEGQGGNREIDKSTRDTRINRFRIFFMPDMDGVVTGLSTLVWGSRNLRISAHPEYVHDSIGLHHLEVEAEEILG